MGNSWAQSIAADLTFKELYQLRLRKTDPNPRIRIGNLPAYLIKLWQYKNHGPKSPHTPRFSYTNSLKPQNKRTYSTYKRDYKAKQIYMEYPHSLPYKLKNKPPPQKLHATQYLINSSKIDKTNRAESLKNHAIA